MSFNIAEFKAEINSKKILHPNLFNVRIPIPNALVGTPEYATIFHSARTLEYWCESSSLPGYQLNTYQGARYGYGTLENRATLPIYNEIALTFIFDGEGLYHDFFKNWMDIIVNSKFEEGPMEPSSTTNSGGLGGNAFNVLYPGELSYRESYVVDLNIKVYDKEGKIQRNIKLREAFPKVIGEVRLDWSDNNTIMRLPVMFAYTDWYLTNETE